MRWGANMVFIAQKTNQNDGVSVLITQASPMRYSVLMRDDDAKQYLPYARVYGEKTDAIAYANSILPVGEWFWGIA